MANDEWDQNDDRQDDRFDAEYDERYSPPKQGMSTGMKVLIIVLCVFGGIALLCCGIGTYFAYRVAPKISNDPAEVTAVQKKIAELDIPGDLKPKSSMQMDVMVMTMKMVEFESEDAKTHLILMEMSMKVDAPQGNTEQEMKNALNQQGKGQQQLTKEESETRMLTVDGQEQEFVFRKGEDPQGRQMRQVTGAFSGKNGTVMLMYSTDEESYEEEAVIKMIESIH